MYRISIIIMTVFHFMSCQEKAPNSTFVLTKKELKNSTSHLIKVNNQIIVVRTPKQIEQGLPSIQLLNAELKLISEIAYCPELPGVSTKNDSIFIHFSSYRFMPLREKKMFDRYEKKHPKLGNYKVNYQHHSFSEGSKLPKELSFNDVKFEGTEISFFFYDSLLCKKEISKLYFFYKNKISFANKLEDGIASHTILNPTKKYDMDIFYKKVIKCLLE